MEQRESPSLLDTPLPSHWTKFRKHDVQGALWDCTARFVAVPAGRRSGKIELAKRKLALAALDETPRPWPDPRYFFGAPTRQLGRS